MEENDVESLQISAVAVQLSKRDQIEIFINQHI